LRGEEVLSEFPGHLTEAAREHPDSLLVVVGGDGTVNEVVNGVAGTGAEVATLPAGTGQDFARTHGIPSRFEDAVRVALEGATRTIDLGRVECAGGTSRYFANVGSVGMSGAVARRANAMTKALGGRITFYYALTVEFLAWRNTQVSVELDGGVRREGPLHDVIVANGRFHGGGMGCSGRGQDDGLFDIVLIGDVTKLDFATTSPKLYSGRTSHPKVSSCNRRRRHRYRGAVAARGRRRADRDDPCEVRGRAGGASAAGACCVASGLPRSPGSPRSRASSRRAR
jgi:diacylglycerol kinase family enzyme